MRSGLREIVVSSRLTAEVACDGVGSGSGARGGDPRRGWGGAGKQPRVSLTSRRTGPVPVVAGSAVSPRCVRTGLEPKMLTTHSDILNISSVMKTLFYAFKRY